MKKPLVAIVGRPNVGKSTFFNRVHGHRLSIVQDIPGVTRDRVIADAEWNGYSFNLVDTGGLELDSDDEMFMHIRKQAMIAVEMADVILFMVDGRSGIVSSDLDVAKMLQKTGTPLLLVVNKMENYRPDALYEFYELGIGTPYAISSEHGYGVADLLDEIVKQFDKTAALEPDDTVKIAIVGKPNAGKSSLVNRLLGTERVIVTDIAGTTRDTIDSPLTYNGEKFTIIDTAGLRRKRSVEGGSVEAISAIKAMKAIDRADVAVILIDADEPVSEQDIRIAGYVTEAGKPSVIAVNKWDIVEKDTFTIEKYREILDEKLKFMDYYLSVFISAKSGKRADKVLELAKRAYDNAHRRISTGVLNDIINDAVATTEPPAFAGKKLKIYYATQAAICPPRFILFVNNVKLMHFSYERYLINKLRAAVDFSGTPIVIEVKNRKQDSGGLGG